MSKRKPIFVTLLCILLSAAIVAAGVAALFLVRSRLPTYKNTLAEAQLPLDTAEPGAPDLYESYPWNVLNDTAERGIPETEREGLYGMAQLLCLLYLPNAVARQSAAGASIEWIETSDGLFCLKNYPFQSDMGDGVLNIMTDTDGALLFFDFLFSDPPATEETQINDCFARLSRIAPLIGTDILADTDLGQDAADLEADAADPWSYYDNYYNPILFYYTRFARFSLLCGQEKNLYCTVATMLPGECEFAYSDGMIYLTYAYEGMEIVLKYDVAKERFLGMCSDFRAADGLDLSEMLTLD